MLVLYIVISLINVFLHIVRSILVIKSSKLIASLANCICYTFSAVVVKFIAETDLMIAILVQATTNFVGCYLAMVFCDYMLKNGYKKIIE
jgi:ABC-type sugar transport system permease subunit